MRPDGLPDQFWDEKSGVKVDDLFKSFSELSATQAKAREGVPEKPDGYSFAVEGLKGPGDQPFVIDAKDPFAVGVARVAHKYAIPQAALNEFIGEFAKQQVAAFASLDAQAKEQRDEQIKALGPQAEQRLKTVEGWLITKFGAGKDKTGPEADKAREKVAGVLGDIQSAAMIELLEDYIKLTATGHGRADGGGQDVDSLSPMEKIAMGLKKAIAQ